MVLGKRSNLLITLLCLHNLPWFVCCLDASQTCLEVNHPLETVRNVSVHQIVAVVRGVVLTVSDLDLSFVAKLLLRWEILIPLLYFSFFLLHRNIYPGGTQARWRELRYLT